MLNGLIKDPLGYFGVFVGKGVCGYLWGRRQTTVHHMRDLELIGSILRLSVRAMSVFSDLD